MSETEYFHYNPAKPEGKQITPLGYFASMYDANKEAVRRGLMTEDEFNNMYPEGKPNE